MSADGYGSRPLSSPLYCGVPAASEKSAGEERDSAANSFVMSAAVESLKRLLPSCGSWGRVQVRGTRMTAIDTTLAGSIPGGARFNNFLTTSGNVKEGNTVGSTSNMLLENWLNGFKLQLVTYGL